MVAVGNGGKIINIGSIYSLFGNPNGASYATVKTGLIGLTRSHAAELGARNIQVNAIMPGWIMTDMTADMPGTPRGDATLGRTPAGRWGKCEDLVGTAVFLRLGGLGFRHRRRHSGRRRLRHLRARLPLVW